MTELIESGRNGFLVDSVDEAAAVVDQSDNFDRFAIRNSVELRFSVDRMVDEYLDVYHRIVDLHREKRAGGRV
jgi:hypothetical protein